MTGNLFTSLRYRVMAAAIALILLYYFVVGISVILYFSAGLLKWLWRG